MSGGVDSSLSAALLKKEGWDVTGVFARVWQPPGFPCSAEQDRADALRVAAELGIPFKTLDLSDAYRREVVEAMAREYFAGRTPNPDILCNRHIKFGALFEAARVDGASFLATGHYAQVRMTPAGRTELLAGRDPSKDQSYFLAGVPENVLSRTLFPIGTYSKSEVRTMAAQFGLLTAHKKDSQGLCFLGKLDIRELLTLFGELKSGMVVAPSGERIGEHRGAAAYTIGQRHGLNIKTVDEGRAAYHVVGIDTKHNVITAVPAATRAGEARHVRIEQTNWIGEPPRVGKCYGAQFRYHGTLHQVTLTTLEEKGAQLTLTRPALIPPGQLLALYEGERCLGGGTISGNSRT